ncbi:MAG: phosphatase PAP2 family protein [Methylocystis sp.]|uniref:phosphatase PAP2 family protein n=1 Tax=Methylocystis sp. TaxID=1911079 RepID=UPI003945B16F
MAFTSDQLAKLTRDASSEPQTLAAATWGQRLVELDLAAVHLFSRTARSALGKFLAVAISKLGNGWIYLILAPIVLIGLGWQGTHVAALAGLNAALLHMLYPLIKRRFGRKRPFHTDPRLPSLLRTLDDHSFPSGHAMTLTGVLAPIVIAWPSATLSAGVLLASMAWSRIATAHHYPSDVAAGVALGAALSYPLASGVLAYW